MTEHQILLYYWYGRLPDAPELVERERAVMKELGLTGRVLIGEEGINGTLEGTKEATEAYVAHFTGEPRFASTHIKRSVGTGSAFPKLVVKLRKEIVSSYLGEEDFNPAEFTAPYIYADELHELIHSGEEFAMIDMRNMYEHEVGHFAGSHQPPMNYFRDLPKLKGWLEQFRGKRIVTVCTGGVRCEKASGYLLKLGFTNVQQLYGGIVTYMEKYPNKDFLGKLYVFDGRVTMGFNTDSPDHQVIGTCKHCGVACESYVNDDASPTREHFICCDACLRPGYVRAGVRELAAA